LVAYYASLLLANDAAVVGKALPVGMSIDSVKKELVRVGVDSGKTLSELTSLSIQLGSVTLTLDTTTIRLDVSILIHAGVLSSSDSTALYPAYPVRVTSPIAVAGSLTAGGNAVDITGSFSWTTGHNVKFSVRIGTATPGDSVNITTPTERFLPTDTTWSPNGNLRLQASAAAVAGIDTLVITLSDTSGHSATSRATFQVVGRDATAPTLKILSPSSDTSVPNGTGTILVKAAATDSGSGLDAIVIGSLKFASSPCTTTVSLAVGQDTIQVQAWDKAGNRSSASVVVTRAKAAGDSIPPSLKITSPSKDTTVPYTTTSLAITASASDSGSGLDYVLIGTTKLTASPYTATINLGVGTDTIQVQAWDKAGNRSTATVHVTRGTAPDSLPPVVKRLSPTQDTTVAWGTKSVQLSWNITDDSLLTKVVLNDSMISSIPGSNLYQKMVSLAVGMNKFSLAATDGHGHVTVDTLHVTRQADLIPPVLKITSPSKDTVVPNSTSFLVISASASDSGSGLASVQIGTRPPRTSAPFSDTIYLAAGIDTIVVQALDNAGNRTADTIHITRTLPTVVIAPPKVQRVSPLLDTTVGWNTKAIALSWTITDDSSFTVTVNSTPVTSKSALYQTSSQSLATGTNTFILQAFDAHGTATFDTIHVTRQATNPPPVIARSGPTQDTVILKSQTSLATSWKVTDPTLQSVTINGNPASLSGGVYSSSVSFSGDSRDSLWVTLVATDSSTTTTRDSIKVRRLAPPTISPAGGTLSGTQTAAPTISSNLPGGVISYATSGNSSVWTVGTSTLVSTSQILYAKATVGGVTSSVDSAVFLYLPVLPTSGPLTQGQTLSISANGAYVQDSLSTGKSWTTTTTVQLTGSVKIFARSILGGVVSAIDSGIYVVPPVLGPNPLANPYANSVTATASDPGASSIQWSTDNSIWHTGTSNQFTASGTFYARSILDGITSSTVSEAFVVKHDTTLKSLTVSDTTVTISGTTLSMDSLPGLTKQVTVVAVPNDPSASVTINGGTSGTIALSNDSATLNVVVTSGASSQKYSILLVGKHSATFTDSRDGQTYKAVKIGPQWWMAQNLNYSMGVDSSWCYNDSTANCIKNGRLYQWTSAMSLDTTFLSSSWNGSLPRQGVCPSQWHVPTDSEWENLMNSVGGIGVAGHVLKSVSEWNNGGSGIDSFGFDALPAGVRNFSGGYYYEGTHTNFWSATQYNPFNVWIHEFDSSGDPAQRDWIYSDGGWSIRCVAN
jgi:uncharacterized protein (TIGR02145 family)